MERGEGFEYNINRKVTNNSDKFCPFVTGSVYFDKFINYYRLATFIDKKGKDHYYIVYDKNASAGFGSFHELTEVESGVTIFHGTFYDNDAPSTIEELKAYLITYEMLQLEYQFSDVEHLLQLIREDKKEKTLIR